MIGNSAAAQYIEALASKTGLPFVSSFLKSGHFIVVATQQDLPASLQGNFPEKRKIESIYDPADKTTWFVAENIPSSAVYGNMLRQIGIHFGLRPMLGDRKMKEVIADARYLFIAGNPAMLSAWRKVDGGKKPMGAASGEEIQEAIGFLVEDPENHDLGIAKKIFSGIKVFLFKKNFPVGRLSESDLAMLAASAAREAVRVRRAAPRSEKKTGAGRESLERRENGDYRKSIGEMTPDEMKRELLVDSLTGLGNRRALDEVEKAYTAQGKQKIKAFIDVDSLKFVNDHLGGHDAGDKLLAVIGGALKEAANDSFRLSGDEFCFLADTEEEAEQIATQALEFLQQVVIRYEVDGHIYEYTNPGFSYGIGKDLKTADRNMLANKEERARSGLRADRAQAPPGLVQVSPPRREDIGGGKDPGRIGSPSIKEYLSTFAVKPEEDPEPPRETPPLSSFQP
jgi:diguanylate cyclase (GGDEF)-like protein